MQTEVARLKASVAEEPNGENTVSTPSESAVLVSQFLSSGTSLSLKTKLTDLLSEYCGAPVRTIASDAALLNFPLPNSITVEYVFNL